MVKAGEVRSCHRVDFRRNSNGGRGANGKWIRGYLVEQTMPETAVEDGSNSSRRAVEDAEMK